MIRSFQLTNDICQFILFGYIWPWDSGARSWVDMKLRHLRRHYVHQCDEWCRASSNQKIKERVVRNFSRNTVAMIQKYIFIYHLTSDHTAWNCLLSYKFSWRMKSKYFPSRFVVRLFLAIKIFLCNKEREFECIKDVIHRWCRLQV